jgi:hypothetical protein
VRAKFFGGTQTVPFSCPRQTAPWASLFSSNTNSPPHVERWRGDWSNTGEPVPPSLPLKQAGRAKPAVHWTRQALGEQSPLSAVGLPLAGLWALFAPSINSGTSSLPGQGMEPRIQHGTSIAAQHHTHSSRDKAFMHTKSVLPRRGNLWHQKPSHKQWSVWAPSCGHAVKPLAFPKRKWRGCPSSTGTTSGG